MDVQTLVIHFLPDVVRLIIIVGWVVLLLAGIEADRPLSGGIPGHVVQDEEEATQEGALERMGTIGSWALFGLACALLPVLFWWIVTTHHPV